MSDKSPLNWFHEEGDPSLSGVTWDPEDQSFNFSLYSKDATQVTLLIYNNKNFVAPIFEYLFHPLENKSQQIWHCRILRSKIKEGKYYAYKIEGPWQPERGQRFDASKILLDPFAQGVFFPPGFSRIAACLPGSNAGKAPLGLLPSGKKAVEKNDTKVRRHTSDAIIYEMHVKSFTKRSNSGVSPEARGTFAGIVEKIPYLIELGVTIVELMPVFQSDPQDPDIYWGYMPLSFFSPQYAYAQSMEVEYVKQEFKMMVKALHEADIEVILDVVYNHTVESDELGPTYSFRGIDNTNYYLLDHTMSKYRNDSGTGNVLRCAHPYVRKLIVESMRFWVKEMNIDGFRFDLASIFARNNEGAIDLNDPPIISEITTDPDFANIRLIAEVWDVSSFLLGKKFPGISWYQWNAHFRDDVRSFVRGDLGQVPALMSRLYGSSDIFPDTLMDSYRPYQSINFITCHDGFSLYDLVSYNSKHNELNGRANSDGMDNNISWNCGHEGSIGVPLEVLALRKRQVKNFCCLLFLSNGTPMFFAGDEFMNTQQGNNNPFNQDNEITWLDWDLLTLNKDIFRFFKLMIAFRKGHPSISRSTFWRENVAWYGAYNREADLSYHSHCIAYCLHGEKLKDDDIYVMINGYWENVNFTIHEGKANEWVRVIDTSFCDESDFMEEKSQSKLSTLNYEVQARSIVVFLRKNKNL